MEELLSDIKEGYDSNRRLLDKLGLELTHSRLPDGIQQYATVVREFFRDVMGSLMDMMGTVASLIQDYSVLVHERYGSWLNEEMANIKKLFAISISPRFHQRHIGALLIECSRMVQLSYRRNIWISPDLTVSLLRSSQYKVIQILKRLVANIKMGHNRLSQSLLSLLALKNDKFDFGSAFKAM